MSPVPCPFSDEEFDELAAWLERRSTGIGDIVELEGLLTAIVIGPNFGPSDRVVAKGLGRQEP